MYVCMYVFIQDSLVSALFTMSNISNGQVINMITVNEIEKLRNLEIEQLASIVKEQASGI